MLDNNYYSITGWMINRLGLKGVQLNVYAIIYGFSKDGKTEFRGCVQYLCDACNVSSRNTISAALNELVTKGYILRRDEYVDNVKYVRYRVSLETLSFLEDSQKLSRETSNSEQGSTQILNRGMSKNDHNNNNNINNDTIVDPDVEKYKVLINKF